jgi:chromate transporter
MAEQQGSAALSDLTPKRGTVGEVLGAFLTLGLTSFGGPIAHLGYFRREFVERRKWLGDAQFAQLLALCQFLPGPASSQLGFSLGLLRAGWAGALAAFSHLRCLRQYCCSALLRCCRASQVRPATLPSTA